jgi:ABC-type nickel/cobalt efflux system permease component RcnA
VTIFIILIAIAVCLTVLAARIRFMLFRLAAALGWLSCAIYLLIGKNADLNMADPWVQVLGFIFIVMTIAVLALQIVTEIRRESDGMSYTSLERLKKPKASTSSERQQAYRKEVRTAIGRGRSRR